MHRHCKHLEQHQKSQIIALLVKRRSKEKKVQSANNNFTCPFFNFSELFLFLRCLLLKYTVYIMNFPCSNECLEDIKMKNNCCKLQGKITK